MRTSIALLLLLAGLAAAKPDLVKDLKGYDPTTLPKDKKIQAEWDAIKADAMKTSAKNHGGKNAAANAPKYWQPHLMKLKKRLLTAALARQSEALRALAEEDSLRTTKSLCDVYAMAAMRAAAVAERRDALSERMQQIFRENNSDTMSPTASYNARHGAEVNEGQVDDKILRAYADHLLDLQLDAARALRRRDAADSVAFLTKTALVRGKHPALRAKVAEILSNREDVDADALVAALKKERDTATRAVLVAALGRTRDKGRKHAGTIARLLDDPSERVRITTVRALALLRGPETVPAIIERMPKESGATLFAFSRALTSLTGQKHGIFPEVWARWWASNAERILAEGLPADPDIGEHVDKGASGGNFYGIPQISQRIVYVIDISGSMKHKVGEGTRLDACRKEFKRAVKGLRPGATFNLIVYNKDARPLDKKKRMLPADDDSRAKAGKFIDGYQPAQNTNIYDALRMAFKICGGGATKKGQPLHADTIYLLTDGSPTKPDGSPDETKRILEAARQWNAARVVTIHTIGIGDQLNTPFLEALARENNGQFIHKRGQ